MQKNRLPSKIRPSHGPLFSKKGEETIFRLATKAGASITDLAQELGISRQAVYAIIGRVRKRHCDEALGDPQPVAQPGADEPACADSRTVYPSQVTRHE